MRCRIVMMLCVLFIVVGCDDGGNGDDGLIDQPDGIDAWADQRYNKSGNNPPAGGVLLGGDLYDVPIDGLPFTESRQVTADQSYVRYYFRATREVLVNVDMTLSMNTDLDLEIYYEQNDEIYSEYINKYAFPTGEQETASVYLEAGETAYIEIYNVDGTLGEYTLELYAI